ncbi:hypothetical protein SH528x_006691 [Novipirellula sp. SH528]|uniref:hypothetical protein n=1 Tax=Novipirellula sp. SH528 TaxID=3454466 RepID=UPI003F9F7B89
MEHDLGVKQIQIAHVDRDNSNNEFNNLAPLCLPHHDLYDTTPRQTKKLTPKELELYRDEVYDILAKRKRIISSSLTNQQGNRTYANTDAERLGLLLEAFDEDSARSNPNGLRLLHLTKQFAFVDGDFAAAQEGVKSLLRLIENDDSICGKGSCFISGQNALPVSSPEVALGKVLLELSRLDGVFFLSLSRLLSQYAFSEEVRGFSNLTIDDVPSKKAASICSSLYGIAVGKFGVCEKWAVDVVIRELVDFVSRMTIAYALQGHDIPDSIERRYYSASGERISPGPNFLGDTCDDDWHGKNLPPDAWFACVNIVARFTPTVFSSAIKHVPEKLPSRTDLFAMEDSSESVSVRNVRNLADMWTTVWDAIMFGKIVVATERQLRDVREHMDECRAIAECGLAGLRHCLNDEHRLLWKKQKR